MTPLIFTVFAGGYICYYQILPGGALLLGITAGSIDNRVLVTARLVREFYFPDSKRHSADWILVPAISDLVKRRPDASPEELFRSLIAPSAAGHPRLISRYVIASLTAELKMPDEPSAALDSNIFNGGRRLSFSRIAAMTSYFAGRSRVSTVKLNQLLFYSDFVNFYGFGSSISGARYIRRPGGPVIWNCDTIIRTLEYTGVIKLVGSDDSDKEVVVAKERSIQNFSLPEIVTLHWVNLNFSHMSADEIGEHMAMENAYRFTPQDNHIAYAYSTLLKKLPARDESGTR